LRHKISNRILCTGFALQIILIVSFIIITIITTDENQLMISTSDSFAAAISDRNIMTTTTSTFLKTSLQSSSQHDSIINSSLNESNSSSSLSQSNNSSNKIKMPQITDSNLTVVVVDGLNMPTTMAFLGKYDFLILQKNGSLVRVIDEVISDKTRVDVPVA
jgi:hypothetical protein